MKNIMGQVVVGLVFILLALPLKAQDQGKGEKEKTQTRIGIGVIFNDIWQDIFYNENIPTIYIPIDMNGKFRIEPELSYYTASTEDDNYTRDESSLRIGLSVFGLKQYEKVRIYYGLRFAYLSLSQKRTYSDDTRESEASRLNLGPAIGAEYLFTDHFSLGAEVGFSFTLKVDTEGDDTLYYNQNINGSRTKIFIRFYF